jgi:two-component system response regulator MtrA
MTIKISAEMLGIVLNWCWLRSRPRRSLAIKPWKVSEPGEGLVASSILQVMLPGIDGIEICRQIRAGSMVPIVMLTAKSDSHEVVQGLEAGADDYMVKPFKSFRTCSSVKGAPTSYTW